MVGDVVATLYICFFLRYISNDAFHIIWIGFALNIVAVIGAVLLVESPAWLVSAGRIEDAEACLQKIAKINGVTDFQVGKLVDEKFVLEDPNKKKDEVATFGGGDVDSKDIEEEEDTTNKKLLDSNHNSLDRVGNDGTVASEKAD